MGELCQRLQTDCTWNSWSIQDGLEARTSKQPEWNNQTFSKSFFDQCRRSSSGFSGIQEKFKTIICLYDNDLAGVKGAKKWKKEFGIRCIFIKRKYAKDISDLFKKLNYIQRLEVKNEIELILKDDTIKKTKYFYIF